MSCTEGYNKDLFLAQVSEMTADLKGKRSYTLTYPSWEHGLRLQWLMRNANLSEGQQEFTVDDQGQQIQMEVMLDDVVY